MSRRKLRTPDKEGRKVYCGPFSLMAVTGWSLNQCMRRIRKANKWDPKREIKGMWNTEIERTLKAAGIPISKTTYVKGSFMHADPPTLTKWLRDRSAADKRAMYLVTLTGHFVVVNGNEFIDTFSVTPVKVDDCPHRRARVHEVFRIGG